MQLSTIDQVEQEECLIDNESIIVLISKKSIVQLGLTWNPSIWIWINMKSVSNYVENTLGVYTLLWKNLIYFSKCTFWTIHVTYVFR